MTYVPEAVESVQRFFTPQHDLDLGALAARAEARAEVLRQLAAVRLRALSAAEARPRLLLDVCAHAPKVAVPEPGGRTVLLLDLGCIKLRTSR